MPNSFVIPERIQLESIFGCNANCIMCPINDPTDRAKGIMGFDLFKYIVDEMIPYKELLTKFDFWGLGEPLLDKNLVSKIRYAKEKGYHSLAIATNADLLEGKLATQLYEAGLDTIIFSIDGMQKDTHESIRRNTNFEHLIENAKEAISRRNEGGYATRFVFRFVRQECNHGEWEQYRRYWSSLISKECNDVIIGYDVHSWGGTVEVGEFKQTDQVPDNVPCHHVFDRLIILQDGTVPLCCADLHRAEYAFGNVNDTSPMEVFNSPRAREIREIHTSGKRRSMRICARCNILESEVSQYIE